jgi:putative tryptophan/tyrosine transport system substrate-binding protein
MTELEVIEATVEFLIRFKRKIMNKKMIVAAMIIFTLGSLGVVDAQPTSKIPRIGIIAPGKSPQLEALRQGLRDFGYTEGQNLLID